VKKLSHFTRKEIDNFFKNAQAVFKSPALTILRAPRTKEKSRLLLIVPRKVGTAPQRNKLKRRLRALFYEEKMFLELHDIGIIARKQAIELSFEQLKQILLTL
jgi:ribonuclease P protein component